MPIGIGLGVGLPFIPLGDGAPPPDPDEVVVNAVEFDGVNDYINRAADLTGIADSKVGTLSFWLKLNTASTGLGILTNDFSRFRVTLAAGNIIRVQGLDSVAATALLLESLSTYDNTSGWLQVLASWDLANAKGHLYINDINDLDTGTDVLNDLEIEHTAGADFFVGSATAGASKLDGCLAQVYFNPDEYIDLSVESNRRKFISVNGLPVDMESDGSSPTGTEPIVFLDGDTASWHTNLGSGGGFTEVGALTTCADSASDPFSVNAVNFDGTNDYLSRGGGLTGAADSKTGILSVWVKRGVDSVTHTLWSLRVAAGGEASFISLLSTNTLFLLMRNTSNVNILNVKSVGSIVAADGWTHILVSWDLGGSVVHIYIDDMEDADTPATLLDQNIDYTREDAGIGHDWSAGGAAGTNKMNGDVAEFYFQDGEFLDFSVEANRRKFIGADGKPVELGSDGSNPTGTAPLIFLSGATVDWHTNKGSGGGFTETGALTDASSSPSD